MYNGIQKHYWSCIYFKTSIHEIILLDLYSIKWFYDVVWHSNIFLSLQNKFYNELCNFFLLQNLFIWWPRNNTELLLTTGDIVWMKFVNDVTLFIFCHDHMCTVTVKEIVSRMLLYTSERLGRQHLLCKEWYILKKNAIRIDFYRPGDCYISSISKLDNENL